MKKNVLFSSLLFATLFLGCSASFAHPSGPIHHKGMHHPPRHAHVGHRIPPPPPPMMHRHHGYHGGHHLRRSYIYTNYGYGYPNFTWGIGGYYPCHRNHIDFGFGFRI